MWVSCIQIYLICIFVVKAIGLLERGKDGISHFAWNGAKFQLVAYYDKMDIKLYFHPVME